MKLLWGNLSSSTGSLLASAKASTKPMSTILTGGHTSHHPGLRLLPACRKASATVKPRAVNALQQVRISLSLSFLWETAVTQSDMQPCWLIHLSNWLWGFIGLSLPALLLFESMVIPKCIAAYSLCSTQQESWQCDWRNQWWSRPCICCLTASSICSFTRDIIIVRVLARLDGKAPGGDVNYLSLDHKRAVP